MTGGYIGEIYLGQYYYDATETTPADVETDRASWVEKSLDRASWSIKSISRSTWRLPKRFRT